MDTKQLFLTVLERLRKGQLGKAEQLLRRDCQIVLVPEGEAQLGRHQLFEVVAMWQEASSDLFKNVRVLGASCLHGGETCTIRLRLCFTHDGPYGMDRRHKSPPTHLKYEVRVACTVTRLGSQLSECIIEYNSPRPIH